MSKLDKDTVIAAFTEAYTAANGKAPVIEAKGGWYSVDGGKNMRLADLNESITAMSGSAPAKASKTAEKPKKEAAEKPAAKKKAPAKKVAKAKKSDFSVKAFWADKVLSNNTGSKLPR